MLHKILLALLLFSSLICNAKKHTISGYITDAETGESLIGANIYDSKTYKGSVSNTYGFYSLTLEESEIDLNISFIGYNTYVLKIDLKENITLNIELEPVVELEEVTVSRERAGINISNTQMSSVYIPMKTVAKLPAFMGETDIIKSIQMLPGVQSGSEGMSGMYVRGGSADQNLILLDGVPVYNVNHLFGFFSVFNTDAIQNAKLVKGGFPARYGGRLSSVLDISMKEGNTKKIHGSGSIGLIASKLTLEGPVNKNSSFIISGRRTYIDILASPIMKITQNNNEDEAINAGYYFYDLNAKINYRLSKKNKLYLSAYLGRDKAYSESERTMYESYYDPQTGLQHHSEYSQQTNSNLSWGNITTALRWNLQFSPKLFSNTTLTYSRYNMTIGSESTSKQNDYSSTYTADYKSGIEDYSAKLDFDYYPHSSHDIKFGCSNTVHKFNPGIFARVITEFSSESYLSEGNQPIQSNEFEAFAEDDITLTPKLKANIGIHYTAYSVRKSMFQSVQPRISASYKLNSKASLKASYSQMNQHIILLTNASIGLPTDLWVPSTDIITPMDSWQIAAGYARRLPHNLEFSAEVFYKKMNNVHGYKEGASYFSIENNWESKLESGSGESYGLELLLMKNIGTITGWLGYTWCKASNQFPSQNEGKPFPNNFDRRHDLSFVMSHKVSEKFDWGLTWVYGSGYPTTFGIQEYPELGSNESFASIKSIEHKNNYRMPSYHRMDISCNFTKKKKRFTRTWSLSIYNLYSRLNPFYLEWERTGMDGSSKLYQYSLFPIMPSIAYKIKF